MSIHSNQKRSGGPTSSRDEIRGSNRTYVSSVQKEARTGLATSVEENKRDASEGESNTNKNPGQGSAPANPDQNSSVQGGYGSGHYKPNKG